MGETEPGRHANCDGIIIRLARVLVGLDVAGAPRIPVPVPGAPDVVAGLDDLGTRGIPVHLVYGTSYWDPHTGDFVKIRDDLKPMRHDSITAEILGAGQTPIYIVNEANHASCKIARAAGYQEVERIGVLE